MKLKDKNLTTFKLFVIPAILILLGISIIGYSSQIALIQKQRAEKYELVTGTVVAVGEAVVDGYDYGVDFDDYEITKKTQQIKYINNRGRTIYCLYELETGVKKSEKSTIDFYVDDADIHKLYGIVDKSYTTIITIVGALVILFGFIFASTGMQIVSKSIRDEIEE